MYDLILVGGGLASCLTAFRFSAVAPQTRVLVLEQGAALGGNHTWSFFPTDLTTAQQTWLAPLVVHRWPSYEVRFPGLRRRLTTGYCSTNSEHFHRVLTARIGDRFRLNADVRSLATDHVALADGERLDARCVIDARGPQPSPHLSLGFQKFTGLVLELEAPHALEGPIIMDATVPQDGDYRFLYTLPLTPTCVLVEDTRYSSTSGVDEVRDQSAIHAYVREQGWRVAQVRREERGVLPITLGGDIDAFWSGREIPSIGLRAALFHATTGYSLADAVRTADAIAQAGVSSTAGMRELLVARSKAHWRAQAYWRLLNRMLFLAAEPERRWFVMQRFYGLRQPLIERFYAGRSTLLDKARILTGRPPVAILPALRCLGQRSASLATTR